MPPNHPFTAIAKEIDPPGTEALGKKPGSIAEHNGHWYEIHDSLGMEKPDMTHEYPIKLQGMIVDGRLKIIQIT